jgi:CYTH domain-containing protein
MIMGEDYDKAKYKTAKKELRAIRAQIDEEKESFQIKLDQVERERDELAEKINQDFRKMMRMFLSISLFFL